MNLEIDKDGVIRDGSIVIAIVSSKGYVTLSPIRVLTIATLTTIVEMATRFCQGELI